MQQWAVRATECCSQNQDSGLWSIFPIHMVKERQEKKWIIIKGEKTVQRPTYECRAWRQHHFQLGKSPGRRCRRQSLPRWSSCEAGIWHKQHLSREPCSIRFCKLDGGTGKKSVTCPGCDTKLLAYLLKIKAGEISKRSNDVLLAPGEELTMMTPLMNNPMSGDTDF